MRWVLIPVICLALSGCSKKSAQEQFAAGEEAQRSAEASLNLPERIQDSLFTVAVTHYESVVEDFPEDSLAQVALFQIAQLHNNGTRDFPKAIDAYKRYCATYPTSPQTAVSLFMIAFLYNNELHQIDSASVAYRRFLDAYPNHELASSASAELDNLGKTPEQILEKHVATANSEPPEAKTGKPSKGK